MICRAHSLCVRLIEIGHVPRICRSPRSIVEWQMTLAGQLIRPLEVSLFEVPVSKFKSQTAGYLFGFCGGRHAMTTVGDILDEFFSPFSKENLWVMPENDNYTKIVLTWQPVIDAVQNIKFRLSASCSVWQANYRTRPNWVPTMTDSPKPFADREPVFSPPGTDPATCERAFIIYVGSIVFSPIPTPPPIPPHSASWRHSDEGSVHLRHRLV
jgi:hypothetical protein